MLCVVLLNFSENKKKKERKENSKHRLRKSRRRKSTSNYHCKIQYSKIFRLEVILVGQLALMINNDRPYQRMQSLVGRLYKWTIKTFVVSEELQFI